MGKHVDVPSFFSAVYLVDLTPSLLRVAEARFEKLGWRNVQVVCIDCRYFDLRNYEPSDGKESRGADLITMSYSLTMIPDFFPVIDMTTTLLAPTGIIGIVDFYAQTEVEFMRRDYVGGFLDRHCTWLNRTFWRTWFEQDRVMFDGGRRDYLEYRFGTKLSINKRNAMLPGLRIPFYIWIGSPKLNSSSMLDTSSVQTSFLPAPEGLVRPDVPLPSVYYQNRNWRTFYPDGLEHPSQKNLTSTDSIGEDVNVLDILSLTSDDVILAPTGSGDITLSCLLQRPKAIHAVDPNPLQNHLLELKLAAFKTLNQDELQCFFEQESGVNIRSILIDRLSPNMSSQAVQYWLNYGTKGWLSGSNPRPRLERLSNIQMKDYVALSSPNAFDGLRIHTASMEDVLSRTTPGSLTLIIVEHFAELSGSKAEAHIHSLNRALSVRGRVLLGINGENSINASNIERSGFSVERHGSNLVCTKSLDLE